MAMLLGLSAAAQEPEQADHLEKFVVGTILHNPPYVTEHPSAGIDLDSVRAIMAYEGVEVEFLHAPIARVEKLLESGAVDAMTTFKSQEAVCFNSNVFGYWHDGVVVPRGSEKNIQNLPDHEGLKVGMFPGAERVLAAQLGPYLERMGSKVTIFSAPLVLRMLRYNRIDAYIGDYWSLEYAQQNDLEFKEQPRLFDVAVQLPPTPRSLCIRDARRLAEFNRGLAAAQAAGVLEEILAAYRPRSKD
jgi:ABC-type amino acid transport substrate-binding protein